MNIVIYVSSVFIFGMLGMIEFEWVGVVIEFEVIFIIFF